MTETERKEERKMRTAEHKKAVEKRQICCLALGIAAGFFSFFVDNASAPLQNGYRLERGSYGQGEREQEIFVDGLGEDTVAVGLMIGDRQYSEPEAALAMEEAAKELNALILGENPSLNEVRSRLNLVTWLESRGISVEWEVKDQNFIGTDGEVYGKQCPPGGAETELTARLHAGAYTSEYRYPVVIFPPEQTEEEALLERFSVLLRRMDETQRTSDSFVLPEEYDGKELSYHIRRDPVFLAGPFLGAGAAFLLPMAERQKEKERRQARERQLMLDYPEIVSKLAVYSGAGLPVRAGWERMVREYEKSREEHGKVPRAAYEEMTAAYYQMQRGIPEIKAYAEFGERCRLLPYRKLSGLLEQTIRKGSQQLRPLLEAEMEEAFEQQKTLAKRMGEEASTKLLVPLFLMLSIVMVMVTMPAFLSFGI